MRKLKILITIMILLICVSLSTEAQIQKISHYRVSDGLSQSVAICFFQDSEGYMWIGTQNGLNKFNGYEFEKFIHHPNDSNSISDNWIYAITEDNKGNLWIGTKNGLNKYDKLTGIFSLLNRKEEGRIISSKSIYGLFKSREGNILVNTPPEFYILNPETGHLKSYSSDIPYDPIGTDDNIPIIQDSEGLIWIASTKGPACFDINRDKFLDLKNIGLEQLTGLNILSFYEDKSGSFLIGTNVGLFKYNKESKMLKRYFYGRDSRVELNDGNIKTIIGDKKGNFWLGTGGRGIDVIKFTKSGDINPVEKYISQRASVNSLSSNVIQSMYIDKTDNLWIGTQSGINIIDLKRKKFKLYRKTTGKHSYPFTDNAIFPIYVFEKDILWLGTWGSGLNIYNRKTGEIQIYSNNLSGKNYITDNFIHTIFNDGEGRIWVGTRNKINIYNIKDQTFSELSKVFPDADFPDFTNVRVNSIIKSSTGEIYLGANNGMHVLDLKNLKSKSYTLCGESDHSLSANLVYEILEDEDHEIWIATTNGLDRFNPITGKFKHYNKDADIPGNVSDDFIISLCQDSEGYIWVGTNSGLNRLNKKTMLFDYFFYEHNFPSNVVYEIIEDNNNDMWFTTGSGLSRFSRESGEFINYTDKDGLQGLEFNINACYKSDDGEIFVGGINGLNSFYPDSLGSNNLIPDIVICSISKESLGFKETINYNQIEEIILDHHDHSLTIEFAALDFTNPKENRYSYVMKGLSDKRVDLGKNRSLQFLHLPHGKYELTIFGSNNEGVWNNEGLTLKIKVLPPWWKTTVAYILYVITIGFLIFIFIKLRERQHIKEKKILEERVKIRTTEINLQKNKVEHANSNLKRINEELNSTLETVNLQKEEITQQRDNIEKQKGEIEKIVNELEIANKTKDKFFSIIAHDLKAPFNSILGFSELLLKHHDEYDDEKRGEIIAFINNSSISAFKLLENLFTWARSQSGKIEFSQQKMKLHNVTSEVFSEIEGVSDKKEINLKNNIGENVHVMADKNMLESILRNLISNAIKFTPKNGSVSVSSEILNKSDYIEIAVTDNGVGMNEEQIKYLFRIDKTISTRGTNDEEGTGLGLILCKEFVEKHGGKITVKSEINKGSSFIFTMPVV